MSQNLPSGSSKVKNMETNDQELLRQYAQNGDQEAFRQIVEQHLGLVLGSACRQLRGDTHLAEDVAQQVFTSLAGKAHTLLEHPCLEGWLYRATRLGCLEQLRAKSRREERERAAVMNQSGAGGEAPWDEVAEVLDEALEELPAKERDLILMRHFNGNSGAEIAARLGLSEEAARKQLERAMRRLREGLARRQVTVSLLAFGALLESHARANSAPALAARIAQEAVLHAGASAARGMASFAWGGPAIAAALTSLFVLLLLVNGRNAPTNSRAPQAPATHAESPGFALSQPAGALPPQQTPGPNVYEFVLRVLDADSGETVPEGEVVFWRGDKTSAHSFGRQSLTNGSASVTWTNDCHRFIADVNAEGYAETRMEWVREQAILPVPLSYELKLEQAEAIGGRVLDEQGAPVTGAKVKLWTTGEFYLRVRDTHQPVISHPYRNMRITTETDAEGRWTVQTIARRVLNEGVVVQVTHPEYLEDRSDLRGGNVIAELKSGSFQSVLRFQPAQLVSGVVLDPFGKPLAGARVTDGTLFSQANTTIQGDHHVLTDTNGGFAFRMPSRWAGKGMVTVKAEGLAPRTLEWSGKPLRFELTPGRPLRLQVLSADGVPIPGIRVTSDDLAKYREGSVPNGATGYQLTGVTDPDGRVAWADVPGDELMLHFWSDAPEYQTRIGEVVRPGAEEQVIQLERALKVRGTVLDAATGKSIREFRVARQDVYSESGEPEPHPFELPSLVSGELFENGQFELSLKPTGEPIQPRNNRSRNGRLGSFLKITAPGYAGQTTQFLDAREKVVALHVTLHPRAVKHLQVLTADGKPETGAEVIVGRGSSSALPKDIFRVRGDYRLRTDHQGLVTLPADDQMAWVVAVDQERTRAAFRNVNLLSDREILTLFPLQEIPAQGE